MSAEMPALQSPETVPGGDKPVDSTPDAPSPDDTPEPVTNEEPAHALLLLHRPPTWVAIVLAVALIVGWSLALSYHHTSDVERQANQNNRATIKDLTGRVDTVTRQRDAYKAREDQVQAREDAVKQREGQVQAREDALKQREDAVTQAEKVQAQNTIHEGNWAVGVDIQPGTYRTKDTVSGDCYWAIFSDPNGRNIVANDIVTGGRPTVTLSRGQYFTTQGCGDWLKVS